MVWSSDTSGKEVSSMELKNTGNLVLLGSNDNVVMWQSFNYPTDALLPLHEFNEGMKLVSEPDSKNFSCVLEIGSSGDVTLSAVLQTLQPMPYWSMQSDSRKIVNKGGNEVASATIVENSWRFYDKKKSLLWEFVFIDNQAVNDTWTAVLCSCLSVLSSRPSCKPSFASPCNSKAAIELVKAEDGLNYFELGFIQPFSRTDLIGGCKNSCSENCLCLAMFFQESSRNCFLLDRIRSFEKTNKDFDFLSYIKVSSIGGTGKGVVEMKSDIPAAKPSSQENSEGGNFLENLTGMPLLAYEYMANGSLDKWILNQNKAEFSLDWDTRFNVALGTAKGLTYLHKDCDSKIVHCNIKPENVLLDEKFNAKVTDFGLAKLITQLIGGRKNYDPAESSEKSSFPYFTFKMMEEGKLRDIIDSDLKPYEDAERVQVAIKVALWCIQEDMNPRPSMTKVVQMLEGLCTHPTTDSGDDEMNLNGSVAWCHGFRFVENSMCHAYKYQVVVPGEDVRRAKMAEAEDGERDTRRRSKASRLGIGGLCNY
ncbi:hypothetical protein PIB30_021517 [Stylosanthes scabra]|uniref:Uncharacterized protein n=1 Tax=Stylosanthes scabra TaxID=79078 RepID=A0ABU6Q9N0_9FABA|nr:hypothetical protein [Stylosanthes scabra]